MEKETSQTSQEKPAGNTKTAGKNYQNYRWFLTIPYEEISASQLSQHLKGFCKKFSFQGEIGKDSNYKHWQLEISLINKEYMQTVKNLIGINSAHIEATKNYFAAKNYCNKIETRIEGPYDESSVFLETPILDKKWQTDLKLELMEKPHYRKIIWLWDNKGGIGKTDFCIHMYDTARACIFNNGKFSDIAYALPDDPKIVIFDLPRTLEERVNYTAIEAVKNGLIFSGKYESKAKRFNKPHVVVMANFPPDTSKLSKDRWDIRDLSEPDDIILELT